MLVQAETLQIRVNITFIACPSGWVQQDSAAKECLRCPASQYSFLADEVQRECDTRCPANANCTGGPVMVPLEGHWVSAAESDSIVTCPNPEACQGSRIQMVECLKQAYGPAEGGAAVSSLLSAHKLPCLKGPTFITCRNKKSTKLRVTPTPSLELVLQHFAR